MSDCYSSSFGDLDRIKQIAEQFGFCQVRHVFSADELKAIEDEMARLWRLNGSEVPDLYSCPSLRWVMLDARIRDIAKTLLGERLAYYRETKINFEERQGDLTFNPFRELHCDARGTPERLDGQWNTQDGKIYGAYRFGVYLRNYRDFSGGLTVVPGSHKLPWAAFHEYRSPKHIEKLTRMTHWVGQSVLQNMPTPPFELYNVPSMPGDIVVFNLRTMHAAGALRFVNRPTFGILPLLEAQLLRDMPDAFQPHPKEGRNTIFFDYAAPTPDVDIYIKWRAALAGPSEQVMVSPEPEPDPELELRNDKVIATIAMTMAETSLDSPSSSRSLADLAPTTRTRAEGLLALCRNHREFSPHYSLYDQQRFNALHSTDPLGALKVVIDGIRHLKTHLS